ncbi:EpsG family protein [Riemerella anatipestifer]|nr:EpsG family protein [Riemerella anatipestifer]
MCVVNVFLYKIIAYYEARYFFVTLLAYFGAHFILYDIHLIRQGLSILIVVYAYRFVENNQFKKYFLYTLVAFGLHTSAIVAFSIPFVKKINLNSKNRIIIIITSVVMYIFLFFGRGVFFSILSVIPITARYANVYNNDEYSISYGLSLGLLLDILLFYIIITGF